MGCCRSRIIRLTELDAWVKGTPSDGVLWFQCPVCLHVNGHYVRVPFTDQPFHERDPRPNDSVDENGKVKVWQAEGEFPNITIKPSVNLVKKDEQGNWVTSCWHGFVTNGEVTS